LAAFLRQWGETVTESVDTYEEIAKLAGVGKSSVVRYASVVTKASESLIKKLRKGEVSISAAYEKVKDEEPPKPQAKPKQEEPNPVFTTNLEKAMKMLSDDKVEAVLIVKDKSYLENLSKQQKKKFAFFKMKETE
jgi:DNA integrity scanning protein DisA with diadenylate cyclase activity